MPGARAGQREEAGPHVCLSSGENVRRAWGLERSFQSPWYREISSTLEGQGQLPEATWTKIIPSDRPSSPSLQVRGPVPAEAPRIHRLEQHCLPLSHGRQQMARSPHGKCPPPLSPGPRTGRLIGVWSSAEQGRNKLEPDGERCGIPARVCMQGGR